MASYHSHDFSFHSWAEHCEQSFALPLIINHDIEVSVLESSIVEPRHRDNAWNLFFGKHFTAEVYKPRRYVYKEFEAWIASAISRGDVNFLEVGCGHGCTMLPLLSILSHNSSIETHDAREITAIAKIRYVASDCSMEALDLLEKKVEQLRFPNNFTIYSMLWNCEESLPYLQSAKCISLPRPSSELYLPISLTPSPVTSSLEVSSTGLLENIAIDNNQRVEFPACYTEPLFDLALCIFTLSSLPSGKHSGALKRIADALRPGGCLLFRDYGVYDMTMYRHQKRLDQFLFARPEGTLAYYFSVEYFEALAIDCGFEVVELDYACVLLKNRKASATTAIDDEFACVEHGKSAASAMRRIFLHAVLKKPE